jgi:hypothetical protein
MFMGRDILDLMVLTIKAEHLMRISFIFLMMMALMPLMGMVQSAMAQSTEKEGRRYYNSRSTVEKSPVYVSPNFSGGSSSYSGGNNYVSSGPLDLKRLARGSTNNNAYSNNNVSRYQGNSYQKNDYSLGLTPDQVRNSRAARNKAAQERQRQIEQQQQGLSTPTAPSYEQTQAGLNTQNLGNRSVTPNLNVTNNPVTINVQKRNQISAPKRVFNGYN